MINSVSVINCGFLHLKERLDECVRGGAKMFHVDLMDGHYVPNLCMPIGYLAELKQEYPQILMDVHLMVTNPQDYVDRLANAGADYLSFHTDSTNFVRRTLQSIRDAGMKPGILINPSQRIDHIVPFIHCFDMVTLMAVEPGFAGQPFLPGSMERLEELAKLRKEYGCNYLINVDGGVNHEREKLCNDIGVDVIIGTIHNIFKQPEGLEAACRRFEETWGN